MDASPATFAAKRETQAEWLRRTSSPAARSLYPFTYERDRALIQRTLDGYQEKLAIERACMARAMKVGDRNGAHGHRIQIARLENARRNGEERLRQLGPAPVAVADPDEPQPVTAQWGMA